MALELTMNLIDRIAEALGYAPVRVLIVADEYITRLEVDLEDLEIELELSRDAYTALSETFANVNHQANRYAADLRVLRNRNEYLTTALGACMDKATNAPVNTNEAQV